MAASDTSSNKFIAAADERTGKNACAGRKRTARLEIFVPLQRHLYGEKKVLLPCAGSER